MQKIIMRTLILLRHAKAVRPNEAATDKERALAPRGRRDAAAASIALRAAGLKPDLALVSTAVRTRQTAEAALADTPARFEDALYLAEAERLWAAFAAEEAESVILVGHNPGIGELAGMLIDQAHDHSKLAQQFAEGFPTCAFAAFEIGGEVLEAAGPRLLAGWLPERR